MKIKEKLVATRSMTKTKGDLYGECEIIVDQEPKGEKILKCAHEIKYFSFLFFPYNYLFRTQKHEEETKVLYIRGE